jgi:hypothetical protein
MMILRSFRRARKLIFKEPLGALSEKRKAISQFISITNPGTLYPFRATVGSPVDSDMVDLVDPT